MTRKTKILTVLLTMIGALATGSTALRSQEPKSEIQEPVVEYAAGAASKSEPVQLRKLRGSRYDKQGPKPIEELKPGIEPLPEIDHWLSRLPALPVAKSDVVFIGEVFSATAYLSNDRSGIYSEFSLRVDDVLKDDSRSLLTTGSLVVTERGGGAVRFPSGRIQRYRTLNQGIPQIGHRYALFLKRNEPAQDFVILTGYELRDGYVFPLDGQGENGKKCGLAFSAFEGTTESVFLDSLREAIKRPAKVAVETKIR